MSDEDQNYLCFMGRHLRQKARPCVKCHRRLIEANISPSCSTFYKQNREQLIKSDSQSGFLI